MTLEELKAHNSVIDDELYNEAMNIFENNKTNVLICLNVFKNYKYKKYMIEMMKISKNTVYFMKKSGAGEVLIPKITGGKNETSK